MRPPDEGGPAAVDRVIIATTDWLRSAARHVWLSRWRTRGVTPQDFRTLTRIGTAPVAVALPGIHEEWRALAVWAQALTAQGWDVRLLEELGQMTAPVSDLSARVAAVLESENLHDVVLVAHSKGGLVGRAVMCGPQAGRVRGMVAVATPFQGSPAARLLAIVPGYRELTPDSPALRRLAGDTSADARIIQVEAIWDQSVPASPLPGARRYVVLPVVGHDSMMSMPRAADAIARLAGQLRPSPDGTAHGPRASGGMVP